MSPQELVNILFALVGVLGGWWMKAMWDAIKELEKADRELSKQVGDLKVLVAGDYVRTERFDTLSSALFSKLDRIENKLDQKVDK